MTAISKKFMPSRPSEPQRAKGAIRNDYNQQKSQSPCRELLAGKLHSLQGVARIYEWQTPTSYVQKLLENTTPGSEVSQTK